MAQVITQQQFDGLDDIMVDKDANERSLDIYPADKDHGDYMQELQLTMATTSINHEYARIEYDDTIDVNRKEELIGYMTECREKYLEAREELACWNPVVVENFERELFIQKLMTLSEK